MQLASFELTVNPNSGDVRLLVEGERHYHQIIRRAFRNLVISHPIDSRSSRFRWGCYLDSPGTRDLERLRMLLRVLQKAVLIPDDLDECFALGMHRMPAPGGSLEHTEFGSLVYRSKPYNRAGHPGDPEVAKVLAARMARFVQNHPTYFRSDMLVFVPPSNPDKVFDLPGLLVKTMSEILAMPAPQGVLKKIRSTSPMKSVPAAEKLENVRGAFVASSRPVRGKSVILVDDIYMSGTTMNEVARTLRAAGAEAVLGLAATKTLKGGRP